MVALLFVGRQHFLLSLINRPERSCSQRQALKILSRQFSAIVDGIETGKPGLLIFMPYRASPNLEGETLVSLR